MVMVPSEMSGVATALSRRKIASPGVAPARAVVTRALRAQPFSVIALPAPGVQTVPCAAPVKVVATRMIDVLPYCRLFGVMDMASPHCWRPGGRRHLVGDLLGAGRTGGQTATKGARATPSVRHSSLLPGPPAICC